METSTTIQQMLAGNLIFVPSYQKAYAWDTAIETGHAPKHTNVFLTDLEAYNQSLTNSRYYFGHFLFEKSDADTFGVIDGQQRLTTIVICLSALFKQLEAIRPLNDNELMAKEDMVMRKSFYRFETVDYDKQLFKDYVIDQTKKDHNGLETGSAERIVNAFDFFRKTLAYKSEDYLLQMLNTIQNAACTTHPVKNESEAIQMFIFQNNRGKRPTSLEIIKARFMFHIHLYGGAEKSALLEEIKTRFEKIYKSIASVEYQINEDDVLVFTLRVYFNSLWETVAIEKIDKQLSEANPLSFIKAFTRSLAESFEHLTRFFNKDEKARPEIHSLVALGGIGIAMPFIIKAYKFGLPMEQLRHLSAKLETIIIRHRLIGTRAYLTSRLNDVYENFTAEHSDVAPVTERIEWLKNVSSDAGWWAYWNNDELNRSIQGALDPSIAKYLLWQYENHLETAGKSGYFPIRYDQIEKPELEHIAPKTPSKAPIAAGYDNYDEAFKQRYIECLGNYLLLSESHNCSVGNKPFAEKRNSFSHLKQQREVQDMTQDHPCWTKAHIQQRHEKIVAFLRENV